ncbi:hypothetical protein B0A79_22585 [Flavobacterium piscis]|uniref:Lipoprotein n=1 Tax=Flavobacterium piscis TaxID=1114874 RepID=A0ABX2XFY4_9FLAO|nr:hypothetical protein [Flavobacterium piscis]OCB71184.1 hypothetical protein FLP_16870 [Flavobacterium piscis]OXE96622.1 hypothetical protein B0A79_22585 [Flavobacterium piscis]
MNRKIEKYILVCIFSILFCNCSHYNNVDELETIYGNTGDCKELYKIKYTESTIVMINSSIQGKSTQTDSTIFYKKQNGYYDKRILENQMFSKKPKTAPLLSFSSKKDTFYTYRNLLGEFYCQVNKINSNKFRTTFAFKDSLKFKYKTVIYYDQNYRIQKIEEDYNKDKFIFISKKY